MDRAEVVRLIEHLGRLVETMPDEPAVVTP